MSAGPFVLLKIYVTFRDENNDSILHENLLSYKQTLELVNFAVQMGVKDSLSCKVQRDN